MASGAGEPTVIERKAADLYRRRRLNIDHVLGRRDPVGMAGKAKFRERQL